MHNQLINNSVNSYLWMQENNLQKQWQKYMMQ